MEIELKTKSLKEIIKVCNAAGWDIDNVKIETKIFEDISNPDDYYVKMYIKKNKKK